MLDHSRGIGIRGGQFQHDTWNTGWTAQRLAGAEG